MVPAPTEPLAAVLMIARATMTSSTELPLPAQVLAWIRRSQQTTPRRAWPGHSEAQRPSAQGCEQPCLCVTIGCSSGLACPSEVNTLRQL
jgi:hypothetical protein